MRRNTARQAMKNCSPTLGGQAQELGRLPEKADITGYQLIKSRFGPWPRVLEKAGLKPPTQRKTMREKREATRRRRKEYKKQEEMKTKERNENEA